MHLPVVGSHASVVHGLLSLQFVPLPVTHAFWLHVSPVVHGFPSLHAALLAVCAQPLLGSQTSSLHGLPSSQTNALPWLHAPALQTSVVVQTLPSALHA